MRTSLLGIWVGSGILATAFCGCESTTRTYTKAPSPVATTAGRVVSTPAPAPTAVPRPVMVQSQPSVQTAGPALPPPVVTPMEKAPDLHRVGYDPGAAPAAAVRTSQPPVAVAGTPYAHAADYGWLSGVVERGRQKDVWLLRYAPDEVADRFGGVVTLVFYDIEAENLRPSQVVRVEGAFLDPDSAGSHAGYRVANIKPMARP